MSVEFDEKTQAYTFLCPHCQSLIQVLKSQINCKIFRHGAYKKNGQPIPPHSSKEQCESFLKSGNVYGCCRPFLFDGNKVTKTDEYN